MPWPGAGREGAKSRRWRSTRRARRARGRSCTSCGTGHRVGTLGSDRLADLVEAPGQVAFGAAKRDGLTGTCRACPVLELCRGGCPKDRFGTSPAGEAGHNVLCAGYRTFFTHALPFLDEMVALARRGRPIAAVMGELRQEEHRSEAAWHEAGRNAPCPCGSGRKYKACCLGTHRVR